MRLLRVMSWALAMCAVALTGPAYAKAENVMVFGGSGQLGSEIVRALLAKGHKVTVFARPSSKMDRLEGLTYSVAQGDVLVEADVAKALKGAKFTVFVDALARGRSEGGARTPGWAKSVTAL